jgi:hypothetical protein
MKRTKDPGSDLYDPIQDLKPQGTLKLVDRELMDARNIRRPGVSILEEECPAGSTKQFELWAPY